MYICANQYIYTHIYVELAYLYNICMHGYKTNASTKLTNYFNSDAICTRKPNTHNQGYFASSAVANDK